MRVLRLPKHGGCVCVVFLFCYVLLVCVCMYFLCSVLRFACCSCFCFLVLCFVVFSCYVFILFWCLFWCLFCNFGVLKACIKGFYWCASLCGLVAVAVVLF